MPRSRRNASRRSWRRSPILRSAVGPVACGAAAVGVGLAVGGAMVGAGVATADPLVGPGVGSGSRGSATAVICKPTTARTAATTGSRIRRRVTMVRRYPGSPLGDRHAAPFRPATATPPVTATPSGPTASPSGPTAAALLRLVGLMADGPAAWGRPISTGGPGVYLVELPTPPAAAPLELARVGKWLERLPDLRLDGDRPTSKALAATLAGAWLPGQTVLYVGATTASIGGRLAALFGHVTGDRRPHLDGIGSTCCDREPSLRPACGGPAPMPPRSISTPCSTRSRRQPTVAPCPGQTAAPPAGGVGRAGSPAVSSRPSRRRPCRRRDA